MNGELLLQIYLLGVFLGWVYTVYIIVANEDLRQSISGAMIAPVFFGLIWPLFFSLMIIETLRERGHR